MARAAEIAGIPSIAIDLDPEVVRTEQKNSLAGHILYGDATHEEILAHAGIGRAWTLVVTIPEHNLVPGIVHMAREAAPGGYLIVRTRYVSEVQHLLDLGADEVIPEEFETSVQAFSRVLAKYTLPGNETALLAENIRSNGYRAYMRGAAVFPASGNDLHEVAGDLNIHTLRIADGARAVGRTLHELDAEKRHNVRILAIRRDETTITVLQPEMVLQVGDRLILHTTGQNMQKFQPTIT
ncbi:MAG: NAD-binding protein [Methanoregula sp.]